MTIDGSGRWDSVQSGKGSPLGGGLAGSQGKWHAFNQTRSSFICWLWKFSAPATDNEFCALSSIITPRNYSMWIPAESWRNPGRILVVYLAKQADRRPARLLAWGASGDSNGVRSLSSAKHSFSVIGPMALRVTHTPTHTRSTPAQTTSGQQRQ